MFADLDDPRPYVPGPDLLEKVQHEGQRVRRRRRVRVAAASVVATVLVIVGATGLYVARRDAAIDRVPITTAGSTDGAINVLLLGRSNGPQTPQSADTITVLRFEEDGGAAMLTLPRDLRTRGAPAAGSRLGFALDGGIQAMVDAVTSTTGIPIDHVVQLDFDGFKDLVDQLGGLDIGVLAHLRDEHVGLDLAPTPCTSLDGEHALQLLRSRWTQVLDADGRWVRDPTGDLGRAARARIVAQAAVTKLAALRPSAQDLDRISRVLADHAVLDRGLTLPLLAELGRRLAAAGPQRLTVEGLDLVSVRGPNGAALLDVVDQPTQYLEFGAPRSGDPVPEPPTQGTPLPAEAQVRPCP